MHIPFQNVDSAVRLKKYVHIIKYKVFYMGQSCEISIACSLQSLRGWHSCQSGTKATNYGGSQTFTVISVKLFSVHLGGSSIAELLSFL